jgi:large conductance mechanosensitive channel
MSTENWAGAILLAIAAISMISGAIKWRAREPKTSVKPRLETKAGSLSTGWGGFVEWQERRYIVDIGIAIVFGLAAFRVISSLVDDVVLPALGRAAAKNAGAPTLDYNHFLGTVITFLIAGFATLLLRRASLKTTNPTKQCPQCGMEIPILATRCGHCTTLLAS